MKPEQWQQAREVLADALELKPEDRSAFLDGVCSSDYALRQEVERLLSSSDEARSDFLQTSALRITLTPGAKLGDYEVKGLLGSGGMGEVYRARDKRLGRDVAIKVLPGYLSQDPDRLRRFEQEARSAAALNHPNILAVFQMGTYRSAPYLVSELLEGGTLREQLVRPIPLRKAIDVGVQLARGLAAAHEKGIVHRDLKPENLFVTKDGRVKILDFGLAKLTQGGTTSDHSAPTATEETGPGVVMGTVGYMAPEQVRGGFADYRADFFAFGAILYEMLTGKRAFQKPTSAETMSAILNEDPSGISQIAPNLSPALTRVVHRCLEKNPEQRFQSASDLAFALEALSDSGSSSALGAAPTSTRRLYWWAAAAVALVAAIIGSVSYWIRSPKAPITPTLTRLTWDSGLTTDPALSPDGKLLAFASDRSGEGHLDIYVQQIGGGEPLRLTQGRGDKREPTFSPDATKVAFRSEQDDGICVVSALGGTVRLLAPGGYRPQFSPDSKLIAYSSAGDIGGPSLNIPGQDRIYVVSSDGGTPRQIRPDFVSAAYPSWSPDGGRLLFLGNPDASKPVQDAVDWYITSLSGEPPTKTGVLVATRRMELDSGLQLYPWVLVAAAWEPSGHGLIFSARHGDSTNLWRIAISPHTWRVAGAPQQLTYGATLEQNPSVSPVPGGVIRVAFANITESTSVYGLALKANEGRAIGPPEMLTNSATGATEASLSRDGNQMVFVSLRPGNQEVWVKDLRTGKETALTATGSIKYSPIISPDGSLVTFRGPSDDVYVIRRNGGAAEMVCKGCGEVTDWSRDGKHIIGNTIDGRAWLLDVPSWHRRDLLSTTHWIATDFFSPEIHWISFEDHGAGYDRAYIAPLTKMPVQENEWILIKDFFSAVWSPAGNLLYGFSGRDGYWCIWAQRLNPVTKQPIGLPFPVFHSHGARLSLGNATEGWLSVAGNRMVFSMGERTGNIWMAEWKEQ
jgi:serine/threonine protein kinase/Tol biopolymer transport system component